MRAELSAQVVELVNAFRNPTTQIEFLYLLANAMILGPVLVDAETAARMVRPYSWLLDRVGQKASSSPAPATAATLEGFDLAASPKPPAAQIRDLAALRWLAGGESVILYGPVGVGKSHIAQALAHLAIRAGPRPGSPRPGGSSPTSPGEGPTGPGTSGLRSSPAPPSWSWTTSACAS
jgi:hypothetical protein